MEILNYIEPMLTGEDLIRKMTILPKYDRCIKDESKAIRLMALNNIYNIYYPSFMATEIYSKLYLAYVRALQKKGSMCAKQQSYQNRKAIHGQSYQGIIGGSDAFTIVGVSGIGKSSAISRAISVISKDTILSIDDTKIIPFLIIQTPCDSSLKGLFIEILRSIDSLLETKYYADAIRSRATLDMLIGAVSQVCLNHICVLVIDEAQNVVTSKNGKNLVNALVQLINNSGISLCFVGTPECNTFFESAFQLARRTLGLNYSSLPYDGYFHSLCRVLFSYQYTQTPSTLTQDVVEWLYLHSNGITAVVVGLVQSAQEIAILEGREELCIETLNEAYKRRFGMLHGFIEVSKTTTRTLKKQEVTELKELDIPLDENLICNLISKAKNDGIDPLNYLKGYVHIEEISI